MRQISELTSKARWIFQGLEKKNTQALVDDLLYSEDDVLDVLLGNITQPRSFVDAVEARSAEYDSRFDSRLRQSGLDSGSARGGRFCYQF